MTWVDQEDKTIFSTHDKLDQALNLGLKNRTPLAENQESLLAEIQKINDPQRIIEFIGNSLQGLVVCEVVYMFTLLWVIIPYGFIPVVYSYQ